MPTLPVGINTIQIPNRSSFGEHKTQRCPLRGAKELAGEIPKAQFKVIDKSGHNPQEEHPAEVAHTKLTNFITSIGE